MVCVRPLLVPGRSRRRRRILPRGAPQRRREQDGNGDWQQPPDGRSSPVVGEPRDAQGDRDPRGEAPVVADDEVPPEEPERTKVAHASASAVTSVVVRRRRRRSARTSRYDTPAKKAITPSSDASSAGQSTPAPSAAQ